MNTTRRDLSLTTGKGMALAAALPLLQSCSGDAHSHYFATGSPEGQLLADCTLEANVMKASRDSAKAELSEWISWSNSDAEKHRGASDDAAAYGSTVRLGSTVPIRWSSNSPLGSSDSVTVKTGYYRVFVIRKLSFAYACRVALFSRHQFEADFIELYAAGRQAGGPVLPR